MQSYFKRDEMKKKGAKTRAAEIQSDTDKSKSASKIEALRLVLSRKSNASEKGILPIDLERAAREQTAEMGMRGKPGEHH